MRSQSKVYLTTGLILSALLTGCGGEAAAGELPAGSEEALGADSLESYQSLYKEAMEAGQRQVVIYGPGDNDSINSAFQERFPGIELVTEQLQGADRDVRLDAESQSGNHAADIIKDGHTPMIRAAQEGRCEALDLIRDVPKEYLPMGGQVAFTNASVFGMVYNTSKLSADEIPKSWEELLDPKWKDKITVVSPNTGGIGAFTFAQLLTPEVNAQKYGQQYLEKLKGQNLNLVSQDPLAVQAVSSGETPLAILVFKPFYNAVKDKGAEIEYAFPMESDNPVSLSGVCVSKQAPNRAAAELYVNWRYSPEGQTVMAEAGNYPVMDDVTPPDGLPVLADVDVLETLPDQERVAGYKPYIEEVVRLFQ